MRKSTLVLLGLFVLSVAVHFLVRANPHVSSHRIGHSYDIHRMRPLERSKKPLVLGGIEISDRLFVDAHSDGDVILHAVTDAILGAAGLPDIGDIFSDTDPRWKDAPSTVFVDHVLALINAKGYRVTSLDVTLVLERPKFAPFKKLVIENLKHLLRIDAVNVKARSHEQVDAVGEGRAVACHAVVLLDQI
jgi:2-C-methyl-D-erythritol 2,4-cyclodiphosphate synthase